MPHSKSPAPRATSDVISNLLYVSVLLQGCGGLTRVWGALHAADLPVLLATQAVDFFQPARQPYHLAGFGARPVAGAQVQQRGLSTSRYILLQSMHPRS
jgi:hypothetical protein